jgi:hypothetical protein
MRKITVVSGLNSLKFFPFTAINNHSSPNHSFSFSFLKIKFFLQNISCRDSFQWPKFSVKPSIVCSSKFILCCSVLSSCHPHSLCRLKLTSCVPAASCHSSIPIMFQLSAVTFHGYSSPSSNGLQSHFIHVKSKSNSLMNSYFSYFLIDSFRNVSTTPKKVKSELPKVSGIPVNNSADHSGKR